MEEIDINGDFLEVRGNTIRIDEIVNIKPQHFVNVNPYTGKIISQDFPKIIILSKSDRCEIICKDHDEMDKIITIIREKIKVYNVQKSNKNTSSEKVTINVADSQNVSIVSQSANVTVNQKLLSKAYSIIDKIREEVEKLDHNNEEQIMDITECLADIKGKIEAKQRPSKFSIKSLIGLTSDFSSISGLAISLGQLFGYL